MFIVETRLVSLVGASSITVWPFIFVHPEQRTTEVMVHEVVHWDDQRNWFIYGFGVGLLLWWSLYLFVLPIGWNPLRRHAERKAYRANGLTDAQTDAKLRGRPYWLWW